MPIHTTYSTKDVTGMSKAEARNLGEPRVRCRSRVIEETNKAACYCSNGPCLKLHYVLTESVEKAHGNLGAPFTILEVLPLPL